MCVLHTTVIPVLRVITVFRASHDCMTSLYFLRLSLFATAHLNSFRTIRDMILKGRNILLKNF
jgi:hypothetical protein